MNIRHNVDKDRIYPAYLVSAIEISNYKNKSVNADNAR